MKYMILIWIGITLICGIIGFGMNTPALAQDRVLTGETAGDNFGISVASNGDINGDGKIDVIVGARYNDADGTDAGRAYIYLADSSLTTNVPDIILTGQAAGECFGYYVAYAGDVDNDGKADVIVGAPGGDAGGQDAGRAYVYLAASGLNTKTPDFTLTGQVALEQLGSSVASAGDVNGDGRDDVVVGAQFYSNGGAGLGRAYVYLAGPGNGLESDSPDFTLTGPIPRGEYGEVTADDVNGDGKSDVIVGACYPNIDAPPNPGQVYIYYSGVGLETGVPDITLAGEASYDFFGISVAAGDVNRDGKADVIVGASKNDAAGTNAGRVYVYLAGSGLTTQSPDFTLMGKAAEDIFGASVASGDVNGDGKADVIVSAPMNDTGAENAGRAYIYLADAGLTTGTPDLTFTSTVAGEWLGTHAIAAGDVNGDGGADVLLGAYNTDRAYIYFSPIPPPEPPPPAPVITSISPATGSTSGGTLVTITGENFVSGATVTIGGKVATDVNVVSPIEITAKTPPNTEGEKDVVITNPDGQSATLEKGFAYRDEPNGHVAEIDYPKPDDCLRGEICITGTAKGGSEGLLSWILQRALEDGQFIDIGSGKSPVSHGELKFWNTVNESDGNYTLKLKVVDKGGNEAVNTVNVKVDNSPPHPNISITTDGAEGDYTKSNASISVSGQTEPKSVVISATLTRADLPMDIKDVTSDISIAEDGKITGTFTTADLSDIPGIKLKVRVRDCAGNEGDSFSNSLTTDDGLPTVRILSPADCSSFNWLPILVSGDAMDNISGVAKVKIDTGVGLFPAELSPADVCPANWKFDFYAPTEGLYTISAHVFDKVGNQFISTETIDVKYSTGSLAANISCPADNSEVSCIVNVYGSADDADADPTDLSWELRVIPGTDYPPCSEEPCAIGEVIGQGSQQPIRENLLARWNTTNYAQGAYTLCLTVKNNLTQVYVRRTNISVVRKGICYGDVNGDGKITANDASLVLKHIVGLIELSPDQQGVADVTGDGAFSALDAALILQYTVGLIFTFPVENKNIAPSAKTPLYQRGVGGISHSDIDAVHLTIADVTGKRGEVVTVPINIDGRISNLLSGEITLTFDPSVLTVLRVEPQKALSNWQILEQIDGGSLRVAFANTQPAVLEGRLFTLHLAVSKDALQSSSNPMCLPEPMRSPLKLTRVRLNEGLVKTLTTPGFFEIPPEHSALLSNYPNPFNPETWIPYQLADAADVVLRIYNMKGLLVRTIQVGRKPAGIHALQNRSIYWNGRNEVGEQVASGVYFYTINAGNFTATRKMAIVK